MVVDAEVPQVAGEPTTGELRAVVGDHPGEFGADAAPPLGDVVDKAALRHETWGGVLLTVT
jgi:hypothetical protein